MTERITRWSARRPWRLLAAWTLALFAAIAVSGAFLGDALSGGEEITSDTESRRAYALQSERLAHAAREQEDDVSEVIVVRSAKATVDRARFKERVERIAMDVRQAGASRVTTFYETGERRLISPDRHATTHAEKRQHPPMRSRQHGEHWSWCFVDRIGLLVPQIQGSRRLPRSPLGSG